MYNKYLEIFKNIFNFEIGILCMKLEYYKWNDRSYERDLNELGRIEVAKVEAGRLATAI